MCTSCCALIGTAPMQLWERPVTINSLQAHTSLTLDSTTTPVLLPDADSQQQQHAVTSTYNTVIHHHSSRALSLWRSHLPGLHFVLRASHDQQGSPGARLHLHDTHQSLSDQNPEQLKARLQVHPLRHWAGRPHMTCRTSHLRPAPARHSPPCDAHGSWRNGV